MARDPEKIKKALRRPKPDHSTPVYLSSGSTLLNLGATGTTAGCFAQGCYYLVVGDSGAGKTFLGLTALDEAANHPAFQDYKLVYDAPERGARMSLEKFFGHKLTQRLQRRYSSTVEEMYYELDDLLEGDQPFVYVEDSESSLSSTDERELFLANKKAYRRGGDLKASYGDGKPKKHSTTLRQVVNHLPAKGSILILVCQTRQNLRGGPFGPAKTRAGGEALTFYATAEFWLSKRESIKIPVNKIKRKIGTVLAAAVKKNRDTGREPVVPLHHYYDTGFSDVDACVSWLLKEQHWGKRQGLITVPEWGLELKEEALVKWIEENNMEGDLRDVVQEVWRDIEAKCRIERKKRYE